MSTDPLSQEKTHKPHLALTVILGSATDFRFRQALCKSIYIYKIWQTPSCRIYIYLIIYHYKAVEGLAQGLNGGSLMVSTDS